VAVRPCESISMTFEDGPVESWVSCWGDMIAEPNWDSLNVIAGLRRSYTPTARAWRTCQYFMKGMSAVCSNWDGVSCTAGADASGFNGGQCDFLGRRHWCDQYSPSGDDNLEEYICVAPNPYLSGVTQETDGILRAVPKSEITGYNDAGNGVGQCDCYGMGRGAPGCAIVGEASDGDDFNAIEKRLSVLPLTCQYYRPYQMSFGALDPAYDKSDLYRRMPLNYIMYNNMAKFQKCQWWDKDYGSEFTMSAGTLVLEDDECFDGSRVEYCKCTDSAADDYNTRIDPDVDAPSGFLLGNVWALGGGHVCNGARPECPCYSGKWNYLTEEKMLPGMPVTANQIFELRFWCYDWKTQDEYEAYFLKRPNTQENDPETASIFTFTKWETLGQRPSDSIMIGKELSMCQPAPLNLKEFIPEEYLTIDSPIRYAPMSVETGTPAPDGPTFPSLIRSPNFPFQKPFTVVYPYYSDLAVFDAAAICTAASDDGHTKYHHTMVNDSIHAIGFTVRNKKLYGINASKSSAGFSFLAYENISIELLPPNIKNVVFSDIANSVNTSLEASPEWCSQTVSDPEHGYFILPPIMLEYGYNKLVICVDFGDGTWNFRSLTVINDWCGGVLHQKSYTHTYGEAEDGALNIQPEEINPAAEARIEATILGGSTGVDLSLAYSSLKLDGTSEYSYSIVEETAFASVSKWGHVGNSSLVFAEIDDANLNYIFNFTIISATMTPIASDDPDGGNKRKHSSPVEMEAVVMDRNSLIPNACVLKPANMAEDRVTFMNSEWSLDVEYTHEMYRVGSSPGDGTVVAGAGYGSNSYREPPVSMSIAGPIANITELITGPAAVIGFFKNDDGRIVSVMATKVYVCIADVRCRNVEIKYAYKGTGPESILIPSSGFATDVQGSRPTGDSQTYGYAPACGDHECGGKLECPMWFPFNTCRGYDLYNVFTFCSHCQAGMDGPMNDAVIGVANYSEDFYGVGDVVHRLDYRYCGPAQAYARGEIGSPGTCKSPCRYYSTPIETYDFSGYGNIRTRFALMGYEGAPPPFGNDGCELSETYLSCDYITHLDMYGRLRAEWVPIVMDHNSFYFSFNVFDGGNERAQRDYAGTSSIDVFRYVDQLSLFTLSEIEEQIFYGDRRRFDEIFSIHYEGNCSYPPPVLPPANVTFYDFKDKDIAWAWQEAWKDVERTIFGGGSEYKLDFILKYDKPKYYFGIYKDEHRLICDEGEYLIKYIGPTLEEGELSKYPTITLGEGAPRPFEIIYDEYDESQVTWKNNEEVGGSSGSNSIYERTMGGNWLHEEDHDMIFDNDASEAEDEDRSIIIGLSFGDPITKYYNRGIEIKIPKSRLAYLPKEEEYFSISADDETLDIIGNDLPPDDSLPPISFLWDDSSVSIQTNIGGEEDGFAITGLEISGLYGYMNVGDGDQRERRCFIKPGVTLQGIKKTGGRTDILNIPSEYPYFTEGLESYTIEGNFLVTPKDMIDDVLAGFSILLTGAAGDIIAINDITLRIATGYKTEGLENIKVWERMYIPSTFNKGNEDFNLDGPGDHLSYHLDFWKSGVYYPFSRNVEAALPGEGPPLVGGGGEFGGGGVSGGWSGGDESLAGSSGLTAIFKARDKMRSAYSNEARRENEKLHITVGNLHDVESERQQVLYDAAYDMDPNYSVLTFFSVIPPQLSDAVKSQYQNIGSCVFSFEKLDWDKHILVKQFKQWDLWQPSGHSYEWSANPTRQKCMLFGGVHMIHLGVLQHHNHSGEHTAESFDWFKTYYTTRASALTAKYSRFVILNGEPPDGGWDLVGQANIYYTGPRQ